MFVSSLSLYNTNDLRCLSFYAKSRTCSFIVDKTKKIYQHKGGSAPGLFKGTRITWGSGHPVEYTETQQIRGILYITNKRVILQAKTEGFDKQHRYLTAIKPYQNAIELQYGTKTYCLIVADGNLVYHVLKMIN